MRDLVDRGRVMNDLFDAHPIGFNNDDIADAFKNAPTIDAVEVVRCRDCLNAMKITESDRAIWPIREDALQCGLIGHIVLPDGYCDGGVKADAEVEG